jgi:hypothetical protein
MPVSVEEPVAPVFVDPIEFETPTVQPGVSYAPADPITPNYGSTIPRAIDMTPDVLD